MIKTQLQTQSFGSAYDPVLSGIARGLADLYPLVQQSSGEAEANDSQADGIDEQDGDDLRSA